MTDKPESIGLESMSQAERDRIDLNHEMSGQPVGRMPRFLPGNRSDIYGETEKKKSERRFQSMLDLLLAQNPLYAQLYYEVRERIDKAQQAVDRALLDIKEGLEASERKLKLMREQAAELLDGTKVFKSSVDDSIYTEDGRRLSPKEAQTIRFADAAPSWEDFRQEKAKRDNTRRQAETVETYQRDVLDHAETRMNDKDNPPSIDELKAFDEDIQRKMPSVVKTYFENKKRPAT